MKSYFKLTLLCILVAFIAGCSETYEIKQAPIPSMSDYNGYLNVKNTDGKFVSETLTNTRLPAGTYKIILFPNSIQFKTLYVIADTQGKITFDYMLDKTYEIPPGFDGTAIGIIGLINSTRSTGLNIPVAFIR